MPPEGQKLAAARGLDLSAHRAQVLTPGLLAAARLVLVMDPRQRSMVEARAHASQTVLLLGDFDDGSIITRAIHDPWNQPADVFAEVFSRLDRCTAALAFGLHEVTPRPPSRSGA